MFRGGRFFPVTVYEFGHFKTNFSLLFTL